jgi:dTDP-4-amino-4,6-dideoxygalactose transaminase
MIIDYNNQNLAINGGPKVRKRPWADNFTLSDLDKTAMIAAFSTGFLSKFEGSFTPDAPFSFYGGPFVQDLEKKWAKFYGVSHAVSMNSATSAIYAAFGALGVGFGDEVIVPAITMTACAVGVMQYGAIPIFADVELETGNICPESIEALITKRTKAILVVHLYGYPAKMKQIRAIANKHSLKIIEDCAQAHLAKLDSQYVGTMSDIGIFSLNVNKTIQVGEGGVCVTNDDELCYRLQLIRNHGEAVVGPASYNNIENIMGFNYRLTEIQAAMAVSQLAQLEGLTNKRLQLVEALTQELSQFPFIKIYKPPSEIIPTYYQYKFTIPSLEKGEGSRLRQTLNAEGCYFFSGYSPLYKQPVYAHKKMYKNGYPWSAKENKDIKTNYHLGSCPNAEILQDITFTNEHIRPPNDMSDIRDLINIFNKLMK